MTAPDPPLRVSRPALAAAHLVVAALLLAPAVFWRGGVLDKEAAVFVRRYWDGRGLLQKVLDPDATDFYTGRELSYALDLVDALVLRELLARGLDVFVPASAVILALGTALLVARGVPAALHGVDRLSALLLLAVLLSSFAWVSTAGLFYRTAKPFVAPLVLALGLHLVHSVRARGGGPGAFAGTFVVATVCCLLDRVGTAFTGLAAAATAAGVLRGRGGAGHLGALLAALAAGETYNRLVGPWIIHAVNGYWPRPDFQQLPASRVVEPRFYARGLELLLTYAGLLGGSLPGWAYAAGGAAGAAWLLRRARAGHSFAPGRFGLAVAGAAAVALVAVLGLMALRHPPVYSWPDHHLCYYPVPFQGLLLLGAALLLDHVLPRCTRPERAGVQAVLAALVLANVVAWPRHREALLQGRWFGLTHEQSTAFRASLVDGRLQPGVTDRDYRALFTAALDLAPATKRLRPAAWEGPGVHAPEVHRGRAFAWARAEAAFTVRAATPGPHRVRGRLWLRPGQVVSASGGGCRVTAIRTAAAAGEEPFECTVEVPAGGLDLRFHTDHAEVDAGPPGRHRPAAFGVFLPLDVKAAAGVPAGG